MGSDELVAPYTHLNSEIVQVASKKNPTRIAIIAADHTIAQNLKSAYPSASVEVIEIDKQVTTTAEKFFSLDSSKIKQRRKMLAFFAKIKIHMT